jgi:hypothetical protein
VDKQLLRDAQLKIADARALVQGVLDDVEDSTEIPEDKSELLDEILSTLDELDGSIEKLMAEEAQTD